MSNVCSKPECCGPTTSEIENLEQQVLDLQNMLGESYSKHDVADMKDEIKELKAENEDLQNMLGESYSKHDVADMKQEIEELKAEAKKIEKAVRSSTGDALELCLPIWYGEDNDDEKEDEIDKLKAELEKVKHQHEKDLALASFDAWRGPMIEDGIDYCVDDEVRWWNKHYWHQQSLIKDIFDEMYEDTFGYKYNIETRDYDVPDPSDEE